MKMISLKKFIERHTGDSVANPEEGSFKGECVSLVQMYLYECFGIGFKARGNAKEYCNTLIKEGLAKKVTLPKYGDIIGWYSDTNIGKYGHVAIFLDKDTCFDQSNGKRKTAQKRMTLPGADIYVRMKKSLVADENTTRKTVNELADEVYQGKWGNGQERYDRLTGAGYDYDEVQARVNEKYYNKKTSIKFGDKVKVKKGAKWYDGKSIASFVFNETYDVIEVASDRIVIGKGKAVTGAINIENLYKK